MKAFLLISALVSVSVAMSVETTEKPICEGFTCPNHEAEGGLFEYGDGCSSFFCDCNFGTPYKLECEEADPPLFFDPSQEVCNWCFNMCDKCGSKCPACD